MPNVKVYHRDMGDDVRTELTAAMTDVFTAELGCPPEDVTILFFEADAHHYGVGGRLLKTWYRAASGAGAMLSVPEPLCEIDVHWFAGKTPETEEKVAARLTEEASRILRIGTDHVEVGYQVMHRGNYFINGRRIEAKLPEPG